MDIEWIDREAKKNIKTILQHMRDRVNKTDNYDERVKKKQEERTYVVVFIGGWTQKKRLRGEKMNERIRNMYSSLRSLSV